MKRINYVLLLIGMISFTICSGQKNPFPNVERIPTKIWDKTFGGSDDDNVKSVITTADGGFIIAGSSSSDILGDKSEKSRGGTDFWLVKLGF